MQEYIREIYYDAKIVISEKVAFIAKKMWAYIIKKEE